MWPIRMDMSWDECRQCLRCLELDAYGNMVSVLRAQGSFTEDKKKLLRELAKVLHITNERHRAEVRRAVNDEKLSLIAEQLNGPNTWTDWAIEGRRTIPLLPRLKSHTAFTGLANSLSLVIAAANEKKIPINEQQQQQESIVKAEASTLCKKVNVDERPLKCSVSNCQGNTRGRKRKRSLPNLENVDSNLKQNTKKKLNNDSSIDSMNIDDAISQLPLSINSVNETNMDSSSNKSRCYDKSLVKNSITCTVSPIELNYQNSINSINSISCHDNIIGQSKITAVNVNSNTDDVQSELDKRLSCEYDELDDNYSSINSERSKFELDSIINDDSNTLTCENTPLSPSEMDRISSPAFSQPPSPITTANTVQTMTINSDSTSSSGPGPPQNNSSTLMHNNLPIEILNHHNTLGMDITFDSNKIININNLSNSRLNTKVRNVFVVRKGPIGGIKLSRCDKKVLGEVVSNNGNQTVNITPPLNSSHKDDINVINTNTKVDNIVVLDIRQDDTDNIKSHSINNEVKIDIVDSNTKTVLSNIEPHNLVEYSNEDCSPILDHHEDDDHIIDTENDVTNDENIYSRGINLNEDSEIESTLDVPEQLECEEILISSEPHVIIDGHTEIYNFESTDDNVCEIQIEETVTEEFDSEFVSTDINVRNYDYEVDDEETVSIPEDEKGQYEQLNDLSDS